MSDWYVDPTATGSNNGSENNEFGNDSWQSLSDISWGSINAGDTVWISGGSSGQTYAETMTIPSGVAGSSSSVRVTIRGANQSGHDGTVTIDGEDTRSVGIVSTSSGNDYLTISHMTLTGHTVRELRLENSTGSIVEYITITNSRCKGLRFRFNTSCTMRYNTYTSVTSGNTIDADGLYIQDCEDTTITHNTVTIRTTETGPHDDCFQQGAGATWAGGGTLAYNHFIQTSTDTVNSQGAFWEDATGTWNIYNNIIEMGTYVKHGFNFKQARDGVVLNIYHNTVICGSSHTDGPATRFDFASGSGTLNFKDNIIVSGTSSQYLCFIDTGWTKDIDYNVWYHSDRTNAWYDAGSEVNWSGWQSNGHDANGVNSDPSLDANYKPDASDDPPVGAGTDVGISDDYDGVTRGSPPDIGAYEYIDGGVSVSDSISLGESVSMDKPVVSSGNDLVLVRIA